MARGSVSAVATQSSNQRENAIAESSEILRSGGSGKVLLLRNLSKMSSQMGSMKKVIELCLVTSSLVFFYLPCVYGQSSDTPASIKRGNALPVYPGMSKRENEQGTVVVRVLIKNNGTVGKVEIKSSSGFFRIDQAVVDTVVTWRCNPENKGFKPVDS